MAYVVKPFQKSDLLPAIEIARAAVRRDPAPLEAEVTDLTERLEIAQGWSIAPRGCCRPACGLTEPEAFRWIQKTAMDLPQVDARGRRGRHRARRRRQEEVALGSSTATFGSRAQHAVQVRQPPPDLGSPT